MAASEPGAPCNSSTGTTMFDGHVLTLASVLRSAIEAGDLVFVRGNAIKRPVLVIANASLEEALQQIDGKVSE
jgi:hypothetical protein